MRSAECVVTPTPRRVVVAALGVFLTLLTGAQLVAQEANTRTVRIPDGTPIPLYLRDDLSSKKNKANDPIRFQVREDVRVDGVVVIPFGTWASGRVTAVGGSGFAGQSGKLSFSVDSLKIPNGADIPLRGAPTVKGGSNTAVTAAATAAYGPAALLMRGAHADIRKGTMMTAYIDGDREVVVKQLRLPSVAVKPSEPSPGPAPAPPDAARPANPLAPAVQPAKAEEQGTLQVKSKPEGAEILLNGKYAGNTPATFRLPPGEYIVTVHKPGYGEWRRAMMLTSRAQLTIDAPLEAEKKGLRLDQINDLLAGGVPQPRVIQLVNERGVDFPLDGPTEELLRQSGAGDDLINAIRKSSALGKSGP